MAIWSAESTTTRSDYKVDIQKAPGRISYAEAAKGGCATWLVATGIAWLHVLWCGCVCVVGWWACMPVVTDGFLLPLPTLAHPNGRRGKHRGATGSCRSQPGLARLLLAGMCDPSAYE